MGYLPTSYCLERIPEVSKTTQAVGLGCPPELNGKTPTAEDKTQFGYRKQKKKKKNQVATDLKISSLMVRSLAMEDDMQGRR